MLLLYKQSSRGSMGSRGVGEAEEEKLLIIAQSPVPSPQSPVPSP
ncbi:MAG: hypothetical protein V7K61_18835 [Nostoc sp.]